MRESYGKFIEHKLFTSSGALKWRLLNIKQISKTGAHLKCTRYIMFAKHKGPGKLPGRNRMKMQMHWRQ